MVADLFAESVGIPEEMSSARVSARGGRKCPELMKDPTLDLCGRHHLSRGEECLNEVPPALDQREETCRRARELEGLGVVAGAVEPVQGTQQNRDLVVDRSSVCQIPGGSERE